QATLSMKIVPDQVALVVTSTPSWASAAAPAGTGTVNVFQAPAASDAVDWKLPVQVQLPLAPWSTNGWIADTPLPAGIQTWNVTTRPAGVAGADTNVVARPAA